MANYGEKDGLKNYNLKHGTFDRIGLGLTMLKVEFWAFQYDFAFQFWGIGQNNVYINKENVHIHSSGGFETLKDMMEYVIKWCEKVNPRIKYPEAIIGTEIDLPD